MSKKDKELKIKAHIPTQSFGFIEVDGTSNDLKRIEKLYNKYAEYPLNFKKGVFRKIKTFTGETILYNYTTHQYTDLQGNRLLGGSAYKESLEEPFDLETISGKVAEKYSIEQQIVKDMWSHKAKTSQYLGNAIHSALEQYFKFKGIVEDKEYHLPNHKWLRDIILKFPLKDEEILPEVLVSDVKNGRAGQIDALKIIDKKKCTVIDFKSDGKIENNVEGHFHQVSFYAHILQEFGWKVEKIEIWNYVDKWKKFESEVLELKVGKK